MGTDGHTASLFPHQTNFDDENLVVIAKHPESGQIRISKTAKLIEQAKRITYLVTGEKQSGNPQRKFKLDPLKTSLIPLQKLKQKMG